MTRMLRPILRSSRSAAIKASSTSSSAAAFVPATAAKALASTAQQRLFATQSSGDTEPPTALARLYLEDGTTLVGKSFGCHESVEGEVSQHVGTDHELFPIIEREIRLVCWRCTNIANSVCARFLLFVLVVYMSNLTPFPTLHFSPSYSPCRRTWYLVSFSCHRIFPTGCLHHRHGWISRDSYGSFLRGSDHFPNHSHGGQLWRS